MTDTRTRRAAGAPGQRGPGALVRRTLPYVGTLPFLVYVGTFLVYPTLIVVTGAFDDGRGRPTLANVQALADDVYLTAFARSLQLSLVTALVGAGIGALVAYAVASAPRESLLRRVVLAASGVLAQFGGVMLAFAFLATVGFSGLVTVFLRDRLGVDLFAGGAWLFDMPGLILVYSYFQVPLMVIVFLPAVDGLRPQWREATASLGGTSWHFWRHVAGPLLAPAFLGSALLLFANAFSAYATAAALVSQGSPIVPLQIRGFLTSEVGLGRETLGKALGLGMVVVVPLVMTAYALLQRRTARWLR